MEVERERVQSFGRVREDYCADGEAWSHLPHDHARSRAYRWGEDGLAGFSDVEQRLCPGWTGLVADIIRRRHGEETSLGDLLRAVRDGRDLR